jgi:molecular chaperone GrpE
LDQSVRDQLLRRFQDFLDEPQTVPASSGSQGEAQDLYGVFVEVAGLRTEVRTESRLVKSSLDQFRDVFTTLRDAQAVLERELTAAREDAKARERTALRGLLLDLLDVRDGLRAALDTPEPPPRLTWRERLSGRSPAVSTAWREGLRITLRRFDQVLFNRRVTPIESVGRPLDPKRARVLATVEAQGRGSGEVVEDIRTGYLWGEDVLRPADVVVNKLPTSAEA